MNVKYFRRLILVYVVLIVAATLAAFAPGGYSPGLAAAYENEPEPALMENLWLMLALILPIAIAGLAGVVGLYLFKSWGRTLALYTTVAEIVLFPFFGPSLYNGIEHALTEAFTLLWGAILAVAYYSPLSTLFGPKNVNQGIVAEPS